MFDVGFWELCLIGLVSLIVIGPEKLPKVARVVGFWVGKTRHMVASVKSEIREELQEEEMRQMLQQHPVVNDFKTIVKETSNSISDSSQSIKQSIKDEASRSNESK